MADEELAQPLPLPPDMTNAPPLPSGVPASPDQVQAQTAEAQPAAIPPPRPPGTSGLAQQAPTKGEIFRNMLGDFLYSAGKGLAAAGHGPEANARGAGEAITAIPERNIQRQMIAIQQQQAASQAALHQAQAAQFEPIPVEINGQTVMMPAVAARQVLAAQARAGGETSKAQTAANANITTTGMKTGSAEKIAGENIASKEKIAENKPGKTQITDLDIKGVNHKVLVDTETGKVISDLGLSKLPSSSSNSNAADTRLDKSYQFHTTQLSAIAKPITDRVDRLQRLQISLDEKSPQADALIAPELLTAMAGGAGSGLRMNEAEISRIVGGRTALESLKAKLNQYQLDPTKGLSITDAQRQQIRSLVGKMNEKVQGKVSILNDAQQQLINAPDVGAHRKILADTKAKLSAVDEGKGTTSGGGLEKHGPNVYVEK